MNQSKINLENRAIILHRFACKLLDGCGIIKQDQTKARRLFKLNWEHNRHLDSVYMYATLLQLGIGGPKDEVEAWWSHRVYWEKAGQLQSIF